MQRILFFIFLFNSFLLPQALSQSNPIEQSATVNILPDKEKILLIASIDSCFLQRPANIDKGIELSSLFLNKYKKQDRISDTSIAHVMNLRANFFHMLNHFDSAIFYYNKAKKIYGLYNIQNPYIAYFLYRPLGIVYHKTGSFQEALNVLNYASVILKKNNSTQIAAIYSEIGNIYQTMGNHNLAIQYYQYAMDVENVAKWMQGILHENIALSLLQLEKYNTAETHLKKSLDLALEDDDDIGIVSVLSVLAQMFYKTDHIEEALLYINQALEKGKDIPGIDSRELIKIRYQLGVFLLQSGDVSRALQEFEQILVSLQNKANNSVLDPWLMISHKSIAKCYDKKYESFNDTLFLNLAFQHYEKSHEITNLLRKSYHTDISKLFLSEQTHDLYISAVENCYNLFLHNNDTSLLYKALQYSEFNKFQLLYEQMIQRIALDTLDINSNIKNNIRELNIKIAQIEKDIQILEKRNHSFHLDSLQVLKSYLSRYYNELNEHEERFFEKSGFKNPKIKQYELNHFFRDNPNKCLLEFLTTDTSFYIFYLNHSGLQLKKYTDNQTNNKVKNLINQLQKRPDPTSDLNETKETIETLEYIYELILKDYLNSSRDQIDHLILIPDQYWSFLSFEALLTGNQLNDWFNPKDFLIQKYSLSYSGSIALYFHSTKAYKENGENIYAGFAPQFTQLNNKGLNKEELRQLEYSKFEIQSANKILGGKTYLDSCAKLSHFKKEAKQTQILHLATHSDFDSLVPMNSRLYFSDTSVQLYEIHQMNTNAQLIILNACNTGIGKYNIGEGVMSISNGFLEAGSKACLTNLWSVDDYCGAQIVNQFILNIQKQNNMHKSLQQAKITFLNNNRKIFLHPYYWASNILSSRNGQVYSSNSKHFPKILLGVSILILIVCSVLIRKRFRS